MDVIKELLRDEGREDEREREKKKQDEKERKHSLMVINEEPFVFG